MEIVLVSSDKERFTVPRTIAEQSGLIRTMVGGDDVINAAGDSTGSSDDANAAGGSGSHEEIPLPNITAVVLKSVLEYLNYHITNPPIVFEKPLKDDIYNLGLHQFDINFIERGRTQEEIYEIITAAM